MVNGHHLTMNLADHDLCFETRGDAGWFAVRLAPLEFWINPEGRPFSVRGMADSRYASCTIDGRYLDSLAGCHFELDAGMGIADPVLARLVQALIAIVEDGRVLTCACHRSDPCVCQCRGREAWTSCRRAESERRHRAESNEIAARLAARTYSRSPDSRPHGEPSRPICRSLFARVQTLDRSYPVGFCGAHPAGSGSRILDERQLFRQRRFAVRLRGSVAHGTAL